MENSPWSQWVKIHRVLSAKTQTVSLRDFEEVGFCTYVRGGGTTFWASANLHAWSGVDDKLEVDKLRSLVQGSLTLYFHQATLSAIAEDSFLATMPECPMLAGAGKKRKITRTPSRPPQCRRWMPRRPDLVLSKVEGFLRCMQGLLQL